MPASPSPKNNKTASRKTRVPRILVLEGLSGAARCVCLSGAEAITVSPRDIDRVDEVLAGTFDGLLLTGGGDVDPRLYGEKPHKQVYGVNELRDYTEWMALDRAKELGVPVLGICRGHQLMTVRNGGVLRQHIGGHRGVDHLVFGESGARFRKVIGHNQGYFVSLHHQVVRRTGDGWKVAARAKDGCIEAVESRDGRCLGVQFHPEMDFHSNGESRRIFRWLVCEAAERAGLAKPKQPRRAKPQPRTVSDWGMPRASRSRTPVPKPRPRGQLALPVGGKASPVRVSWLCPTCGIKFDKQQDREDHVFWLHGEPH